jgi:DNA-binding transcriptional LysR family regulator
MTKLSENPLHILLPRGHVLSSRDSLSLKDLRDERWIIFQRRIHPLLYEGIMKRAREEGFHPKGIDHILYPDEAEHLLLASRGVAFVTKANASKLTSDRLIAKPLDEQTLCLDEWLAARADETSRLVSEFVRAFVNCAKIVLPPQLSLPMGASAHTSTPLIIKSASVHGSSGAK